MTTVILLLRKRIFIIFDAENKSFSMRPTEKELLGSYLPAEAVEPVLELLKEHRIHLIITRNRISKLGDFKPGNAKRSHTITVNGSLNKYSFLLVFLHELSHFFVYEQCGHRVRPHGKEWKQQFGAIVRKAVQDGMFHPSLENELTAYSYRVKATGMADIALSMALAKFDGDNAFIGWPFLDELPRDVVFQTMNGRTFVKEEKVRTRYRCLCVDSKRRYLISHLARVKPLPATGQQGVSENHQIHTDQTKP